MSFQRNNLVGWFGGLALVVIVAVFLIHPMLPNSENSASSSEPTPIADVSAPTNNAISTTALATTPAATATPTPLPDHYIWIPWRSQFDGTVYESANCGPASLAMAMSYFGEWWSTNGVRKSTNARSGMIGSDDGTDWTSLQYAAESRDFSTIGPFDSSGAYKEWTIDELMEQIEQEHPVILLVKHRAMPGHSNSTYQGDHYIVFLGEMADGRVVYHDPAFSDEIDGSYRITSQETLLEAWTNTSVGQRRTAMALSWDHDGRKWDDPLPTPSAPQSAN